MSKTFCRHAAVFIAGIIFGATTAPGADSPATFLGANACASSGCHGGGGAKQNQFLTWSLQDFHSQRPPATLTTARSKQIAAALAIPDPTVDARCTSCHAPLQAVPETLRGEYFKVSEGVSCESCHGPAAQWLRSHTRSDFTRADRTAAGLRDLENLYVRANTCVACHQVVSPPLLQAGHPELIFELDGQCVAEPKHWTAAKNGNGAQAWLVGQAVALREMSWQLAQEKSPTTNDINRWAGLAWLIQTTTPHGDLKTPLPVASAEAVKAAGRIQSGSEVVARTVAAARWTEDMTRNALTVLANASGSFREAAVSQNQQARRAERLVLALDRLLAALPEGKNNAPAQAALNQLFRLAQSVPDFEAKPFATALDQLAAALGPR